MARPGAPGEGAYTPPLPPEISDGQGKAQADLYSPGKRVDQELHLGAVVFLQQDAIGTPQDIPGKAKRIPPIVSA